MAISRIATQDAKGVSSVASVSATYLATASTGDLLIATAFGNGGPANAITISGWTSLADYNFSGNFHLALLYKLSAGTEAQTIANQTSATIMRLHIYEYTGNANPISTDGVASSSTTSATSLGTATINTSNANDLIFCSWGTSAGITSPSISTAGFSLRQQDTTIRMFDADQIVSATGAYNCMGN